MWRHQRRNTVPRAKRPQWRIMRGLSRRRSACDTHEWSESAHTARLLRRNICTGRTATQLSDKAPCPPKRDKEQDVYANDEGRVRDRQPSSTSSIALHDLQPKSRSCECSGVTHPSRAECLRRIRDGRDFAHFPHMYTIDLEPPRTRHQFRLLAMRGPSMSSQPYQMCAHLRNTTLK